MRTIIVGCISLLCVVLFFKYPYLLTAILLFIAGAWLYFLRDKKYVLVFLVVGMSGFFAEVIAVHYGVWTYSLPQILDLPLWLPVLWGIAGTFIVTLGSKI